LYIRTLPWEPLYFVFFLPIRCLFSGKAGELPSRTPSLQSCEVGDRVALQIKLTPGQVQESVTAAAGQLQLKSESG
jgi:hypothetical protein